MIGIPNIRNGFNPITTVAPLGEGLSLGGVCQGLRCVVRLDLVAWAINSNCTKFRGEREHDASDPQPSPIHTNPSSFLDEPPIPPSLPPAQHHPFYPTHRPRSPQSHGAYIYANCLWSPRPCPLAMGPPPPMSPPRPSCPPRGFCPRPRTLCLRPRRPRLRRCDSNRQS
jgi:hypothetical protein